MSSDTFMPTVNCTPAFNPTLDISCVIQLIRDLRNGFNVGIVQKALWITGSALNQFSLPTDPEALDSSYDFESCLDQLEVTVAKVEAHTVTINTAATKDEVEAARREVTKDWTVILPILLQLLPYLIDFLKKRQPAPTPTPTVE